MDTFSITLGQLTWSNVLWHEHGMDACRISYLAQRVWCRALFSQPVIWYYERVLAVLEESS